jgi:Icc-related predicted phosphoesterase
MGKLKITFISDTHTKHNQITKDLPGGDILIHAGDMSSMGYKHEIEDFCKWFDGLDNYDTKVFIAGNHDWGFQDNVEQTTQIIDSYKSFDYLQDGLLMVGENYDDMVKIYGSPWQPEFYNWAFNLPRNGEELKSKWDLIPMNTDILITHGPAWGYVDKVIGRTQNLGCELLAERIKVVKPKIHVCGHIHSGRNIVFDDETLYINASVLGEQYQYIQKPITIDFDFKTGEWEVIQF